MKSKTDKETLGSVLISVGVITAESYKAALEKAAGDEGKVPEALISLGFCTEAQIIKGLGVKGEIPSFVELEGLIDEKVKELVPESLCRRYEVMPLFKQGDLLMVAMLNPYDIIAIDGIARHTQLSVQPVISSRKAILDAIGLTYAKSKKDRETEKTSLIEGHIKRAIEDFKTESIPENVKLEIVSGVSAGKAAEDEQPVIKLVDYLIIEAIGQKASDIHIEPWSDRLIVRYRNDGVLRNTMRLPKELGASITARVKIMARMDISITRSPQDGKIQIRLHAGLVDLRVNTLPLATGEKTVIRILDKQAMTPDLTLLGFPPEMFLEFGKAIKSANGIILVTGPTGSGKTTTLYSALKTITDEKKNISTLEDPVEYQIDGICQVQVNPQVGLTFASGLRALLRQDPDVVLVGEIRDSETAEIAIRAALTGHLVMSTLHTNDAVGAIFRLNNMEIDPFLLNSALRGVLAQRLIRLLCPVCRIPYTPEDALLKDLGLKIEDGPYKFYREKERGCDKCYHTGFKGRRGIFEYLPLVPEVRNQIVNKAASDRIYEAAVRAGFQTMRQHALPVIIKGDTTAEEVLRVTRTEN